MRKFVPEITKGLGLWPVSKSVPIFQSFISYLGNIHICHGMVFFTEFMQEEFTPVF